MVTGDSNLITIEDVFIRHTTDGALLVQVGAIKAWVPKSQVEYDAGENTLTLPEWLAIEKELV